MRIRRRITREGGIELVFARSYCIAWAFVLGIQVGWFETYRQHWRPGKLKHV